MPRETATTTTDDEPSTDAERSGDQSDAETTTALETFNPASSAARRASRAPGVATTSAAERPAREIAIVALTTTDAFTVEKRHGHVLGV